MARVWSSKRRSRMRSGAVVAGTLVLALAASASAFAASTSTAAPDKATEKRWRAACTHDAFDFCTFLAFSGNRGGVRNCLVRNIDRISPGCRAIIRAGRPQPAPPSPPPASPSN